MRFLTTSLLLLALGGCVAAEQGVDMVRLRRASVAALENGGDADRLAAAKREASLGISRIARPVLSGATAVQPDDLSGFVTPEGLVSSAQLDDLEIRRGSLAGPRESIHALPPGATARFSVGFRARQSALVLVTSMDAPLRLEVKGTGSPTCIDTVRRGVAFCRMRPQKEANFDIFVTNPTAKRARFSLLNN